MRKICIIICLLCAAVFSGQAQKESLYFERIDIKNGLSQNTVNEIIQDSRGFMWFGTKDGLNRYDGTSFKVFKARLHDDTALGNSQIRSLIEDRKGNILVGTNSGLWRYDTERDRFSEVIVTDGARGGYQQSCAMHGHGQIRESLCFRGGGGSVLL